MSRQAATDVAPQESQQSKPDNAPTSRDMSRQAAAVEAESSRYVVRLEGEVEFLRGQITTKDLQIKELSERSRETNVLIGGLQRLLAPLLGSPDPHSSNNVNHNDQSGTGNNA
jgi:hypothetical protein